MNENENHRILSTQMKLTDFVTFAARSDNFFHGVAAPEPGIAMRRPSPESAETRKVGAKTVRGKIQNFFYFAPGAQTVQLAGDFTNWREQPVNLRKGADGTWWVAVRLEIGTHYYRFLVDGQWRDDPDCPLVVPNPFGSLNAVRQVYG